MVLAITLLDYVDKHSIHGAQDIMALYFPFATVPSNCMDILLLTNSFPKLGTVLTLEKFGTTFEVNSFHDWLSFTADLPLDQVSHPPRFESMSMGFLGSNQ